MFCVILSFILISVVVAVSVVVIVKIIVWLGKRNKIRGGLFAYERVEVDVF